MSTEQNTPQEGEYINRTLLPMEHVDLADSRILLDRAQKLAETVKLTKYGAITPQYAVAFRDRMHSINGFFELVKFIKTEFDIAIDNFDGLLLIDYWQIHTDLDASYKMKLRADYKAYVDFFGKPYDTIPMALLKIKQELN